MLLFFPLPTTFGQCTLQEWEPAHPSKRGSLWKATNTQVWFSHCKQKKVDQRTSSVLKIQKIGTSRMKFHRFWFGRNGNTDIFGRWSLPYISTSTELQATCTKNNYLEITRPELGKISFSEVPVKRNTGFIPFTLVLPAAVLVAFLYIHNKRLMGKAEMKCLIRLCCCLWHKGIFPILQDTSRPVLGLCPFLPVTSGSPHSHGFNQFAILPGNLDAQAAALLSLPLKATGTLFFIILISVLMIQLKTTREAIENNKNQQ